MMLVFVVDLTAGLQDPGGQFRLKGEIYHGCVFPGSDNYPKLVGLEVIFFSQEINYVPCPRANNASIIGWKPPFFFVFFTLLRVVLIEQFFPQISITA